jgi:heme O synthase-like polyprenyltransferase
VALQTGACIGAILAGTESHKASDVGWRWRAALLFHYSLVYLALLFTAIATDAVV